MKKVAPEKPAEFANNEGGWTAPAPRPPVSELAQIAAAMPMEAGIGPELRVRCALDLWLAASTAVLELNAPPSPFELAKIAAALTTETFVAPHGQIRTALELWEAAEKMLDSKTKRKPKPYTAAEDTERRLVEPCTFLEGVAQITAASRTDGVIKPRRRDRAETEFCKFCRNVDFGQGNLATYLRGKRNLGFTADEIAELRLRFVQWNAVRRSLQGQRANAARKNPRDPFDSPL